MDVVKGLIAFIVMLGAIWGIVGLCVFAVWLVDTYGLFGMFLVTLMITSILGALTACIED